MQMRALGRPHVRETVTVGAQRSISAHRGSAGYLVAAQYSAEDARMAFGQRVERDYVRFSNGNGTPSEAAQQCPIAT
jgi:hypothetical protein